MKKILFSIFIVAGIFVYNAVFSQTLRPVSKSFLGSRNQGNFVGVYEFKCTNADSLTLAEDKEYDGAYFGKVSRNLSKNEIEFDIYIYGTATYTEALQNLVAVGKDSDCSLTSTPTSSTKVNPTTIQVKQ